jgi:hypothetical protein
MLLHQLAHSRTGDKGNIVTISLIAFRKEDFPLLEEKVTADRVAAHFAELLQAPGKEDSVQDPVQRYTLPQLGALNFVLHRPIANSVTRSLALDAHGKCLGSALLALEI